jgi:hypothetical protein
MKCSNAGEPSRPCVSARFAPRHRSTPISL